MNTEVGGPWVDNIRSLEREWKEEKKNRELKRMEGGRGQGKEEDKAWDGPGNVMTNSTHKVFEMNE